jgi:carbamoyltransferase
MRICGIKLGHDGSVAVIEDGRLRFSIELEKLDNQVRHCPLTNLDAIFATLRGEGLAREDIDRFVIDGWHAHSRNMFHWGQRELRFARAPYIQTPLHSNLLDCLEASESGLDYVSWPHYAGHVIGAWCTSPFAAAGQSAFVLSWDGGMVPYLYYVHGDSGRVENVGAPLSIVGDLYAEVAAGRGPFNANPSSWESLGTPGKIMAYAAYGQVREDLVHRLGEHFAPLPPLDDASLAQIYPANFEVLRAIRADHLFAQAEGADVIASYHAFIQERLVDSLSRMVQALPGHARRLCYAGGCALNIKWNQAIRASGAFEQMWIPPFPNDAGSAIGAASCAMLAQDGHLALDWDVYAGPAFRGGDTPPGWQVRPCSPRELARVLHDSGQPVLFLGGRAELGPRALGNRSILAPAVDARMKQQLNAIKDREDYRPVAPICLEQHAAEVFDPGGADPYMLYDHQVRPAWLARVPAILHHDGSARLQTVNAAQNPAVHELLLAYHALSGVPLLCNTSANHKHKGFFPDLASAAAWPGTNLIWSGGRLYTRSAQVDPVHRADSAAATRDTAAAAAAAAGNAAPASAAGAAPQDSSIAELKLTSLWFNTLLEQHLPGHEPHTARLAQLVEQGHAASLFESGDAAVAWLKANIVHATGALLREAGFTHAPQVLMRASVQIQHLGAFDPMRNQPGSYFTGLYVLRAPSGAPALGQREDARPGCISFYDPRVGMNMNAIRKDPYVLYHHTVKFEPGLLLMWPSYVPYFVHPHLASEPAVRVCLDVRISAAADA